MNREPVATSTKKYARILHTEPAARYTFVGQQIKVFSCVLSHAKRLGFLIKTFVRELPSRGSIKRRKAAVQ
jgi:hypothetical protein